MYVCTPVSTRSTCGPWSVTWTWTPSSRRWRSTTTNDMRGVTAVKTPAGHLSNIYIYIYNVGRACLSKGKGHGFDSLHSHFLKISPKNSPPFTDPCTVGKKTKNCVWPSRLIIVLMYNYIYIVYIYMYLHISVM